MSLPSSVLRRSPALRTARSCGEVDPGPATVAGAVNFSSLGSRFCTAVCSLLACCLQCSHPCVLRHSPALRIPRSRRGNGGMVVSLSSTGPLLWSAMLLTNVYPCNATPTQASCHSPEFFRTLEPFQGGDESEFLYEPIIESSSIITEPKLSNTSPIKYVANPQLKYV